jgi:hypothetical protein
MFQVTLLASAMALVAAASTAAAKDVDFMTGVFSDDADTCRDLAATGHAGPVQGYVLTAQTIRAPADFLCNFVDVRPMPGVGWFATAMCASATAGNYPDVAAITPSGNGGVNVVFLTEGRKMSSLPPDEPDTDYMLCPGVSPDVVNKSR